jgi:hypothetical protein
MNSQGSKRRWLWRTAAAALLLAACLPLLPRAMAYMRAQLAPWGQVCSVATPPSATAPSGG